MKYIRTVDGIFEKDLIIADILNGFKDSVPPEDTIIKEADTIEELCDEFVVVDNERHFIEHYDLDLEDKYLRKRYCLSSDYKIYGAIWTEWGLKYAAKMNEKGELELI